MKIYAVVYYSEMIQDTLDIGYFRDRETAKEQIRKIRNPGKGDWAFVHEIEILDEPRDGINMHGESDVIDFEYYNEDLSINEDTIMKMMNIKDMNEDDE